MRTHIQYVVDSVISIGIFVASLIFLATSNLWVLIGWEVAVVAYLIYIVVRAWGGEPREQFTKSDVRSLSKWMWIPPLVIAAAGANAAIVALAAMGRAHNTDYDVLVMATAGVGIVLSWMMLQVGFAEIYEVIDQRDDAGGLQFPNDASPAVLDYLYFAATIGSSFATSDVNITTAAMRRVVLAQSVICFFYNALVVAVAFQILQRLIGG